MHYIKLWAFARVHCFHFLPTEKKYFGFVDDVSSASRSRGSHICVILGVWMSWERSDRAESLFFLCKAAECIVCADGQGLGGSALRQARRRGGFGGGRGVKMKTGF